MLEIVVHCHYHVVSSAQDSGQNRAVLPVVAHEFDAPDSLVHRESAHDVPCVIRTAVDNKHYLIVDADRIENRMDPIDQPLQRLAGPVARYDDRNAPQSGG
jgi:hypothetical protein